MSGRPLECVGPVITDCAHIFALNDMSTGLNGLGFMSISLDWATISAILGSPLSTPWPTTLNVFIGFVFSAYVVIPAMYVANTFNTQRYPLISNKLYLPDGRRYEVSEVSMEYVFPSVSYCQSHLATGLRVDRGS